MIGSVTRKSECITAVMVLVPAASAGSASAPDSAMTGKANFLKPDRRTCNIHVSPDLKLITSLGDLHQACHASIGLPTRRNGAGIAASFGLTNESRRSREPP